MLYKMVQVQEHYLITLAYQFVSGAAPTLSTGAADVDILVYSTRSASTIDAALLKNFD